MKKKRFLSVLCLFLATIVLFLVFFFRYYIVWEDLPKNSKFYFTIIGLGIFSILLISSGILRYLAIIKRRKQIERKKKQEELMSWQDDFYPDRTIA